MINLLQATAPAPQAGGGYSLFIMLGLMILVLYFFMWRPESKRRKQMAQFRAGLKKGDKIITAGGIYGVVKEIKETTLLIEVDGNHGDVLLRECETILGVMERFDCQEVLFAETSAEKDALWMLRRRVGA